eukprot:5957550-Amphidinium_carterae.1
MSLCWRDSRDQHLSETSKKYRKAQGFVCQAALRLAAMLVLPFIGMVSPRYIKNMCQGGTEMQPPLALFDSCGSAVQAEMLMCCGVWFFRVRMPLRIASRPQRRARDRDIQQSIP